METFDIELLDRLSIVRKSGLTFAIESGSREGQLSINKQVMPEKIKKIISYGIGKGWKLIKLYFMIGLPHINNEKESIIDFITDLLSMSKKIKMNINLAVFVPKSHTPYQNERQLDLEESIGLLNEIKERFRKTRAVIKTHDPYMSFVEGIISRGDEKVGLAVYDAFKDGAKFDGWDDRFDFEKYRNAFDKNGIDCGKYLAKKDPGEIYFWDNIDVGMEKEFYKTENEKSKRGKLTKSCKEDCDEYCKICKPGIKKINAVKEEIDTKFTIVQTGNNEKLKKRFFIEFSKLNLSRFIGHIDTIKYFERLFNLSKTDITFTEGFNPHPRMQFSPPLPLGVESVCEILEIRTNTDYNEENLLEILKKYENPDYKINRIKHIESLEKKSLINMLHTTEFCALFDKIYYNQVIKIIEDYKKNNKNYILNKNGKKIEGYYQDFLSIYEPAFSHVCFDLLNINSIPRFLDIISFVFQNIPVITRKMKMKVKSGDGFIDLFDIFDNRLNNG